MAKRLHELYPLGGLVEVYFEAADRWFLGMVIKHDHPAVWVRTADGRSWFVTNRGRIRPVERENNQQNRED